VGLRGYVPHGMPYGFTDFAAIHSRTVRSSTDIGGESAHAPNHRHAGGVLELQRGLQMVARHGLMSRQHFHFPFRASLGLYKLDVVEAGARAVAGQRLVIRGVVFGALVSGTGRTPKGVRGNLPNSATRFGSMLLAMTM